MRSMWGQYASARGMEGGGERRTWRAAASASPASAAVGRQHLRLSSHDRAAASGGRSGLCARGPGRDGQRYKPFHEVNLRKGGDARDRGWDTGSQGEAQTRQGTGRTLGGLRRRKIFGWAITLSRKRETQTSWPNDKTFVWEPMPVKRYIN